MNIAFDASALLSDMSKNRGIGNYTTCQMEALIKSNPSDNFFCLNLYNEAIPTNWENTCVNFQEVNYFSGKSIELIRFQQYEDVVCRIMKEFLEEYEIDIFYVTNPLNLINMPYKKEWFGSVKVVVTLYDVIVGLFPDKYFISRERQREYLKRIDFIKEADAVLSISKSAKDDFVSLYHADEEKVHVIDAAPDRKKFWQMKTSKEEEKKVKEKYGIQDSFFICIGGDDDRKNLERLLLAFAKSEASKRMQLVITCKLSERTIVNIKKIATENAVEDRVCITGYLQSEELTKLLTYSRGLLFPSLYEGFGLPIVEAWACGVPCLTSNGSSLVEIGGDAAVLVDPYHVESICEGIDKLAEEENYVKYRRLGEAKVEEYTWEKVANKTMESIKTLNVFHPEKEHAVKKIAFFAPLPPMESGISDYSFDMACELSKQFDLDVYIDNSYTPSCKLPENVGIYSHYMFADKRNEYDEILYQVGCSKFHEYMFDYIKEFSGIVVLHDVNMHSVAEYLYGIRQGRGYLKYKQLLMEDLSKEEFFRFIDRRLSNADASSIDANIISGYISKYASKLIVHSEYAKKTLLDKNSLLKIKKIPLYTKREPRILTSNRKKIVVSGIITLRKRPTAIISAFHKLLADYPDTDLIFAGKYVDEKIQEQIETIIADEALKGRVKVTGFIELDDFIKEMREATAIINLRFPYYGENSAILSRALGMGKCVILNNVGSFGEVPEDACIQIPAVDQMTPAEEVEQIYQAMKKALNDEIRTEIEEKAYSFAQENLLLEKVVSEYCDVINGTWNSKITNDKLRKYLKKQEGLVINE